MLLENRNQRILKSESSEKIISLRIANNDESFDLFRCRSIERVGCY